MASLTIQSVKKTYGSVPVLHGVDLDIKDGEFLILVGPSGCGKSTLLRMIAGLESITGGTIKIGDRVVNDLPPKSRDIAMVFQSYALYPHMTVAQNMGFSLKLARRPKAEIDAAVRKAAEILALENLLDRTPKQLSGGQRQRVAMGRAIVRNPAVFLFDEPLSNLDAKLRVQMRAEIKELHQRLGTTIVYVTHDQIEAMTMADRIVVMHGGLAEQVGRPLDLYDRPANLFVAGFIGSPAMNLIEGALDEPGIFVTSSGARIPVPGLAARSGAQFVLGVRPEHLELADAALADAIAGQVAVTEPTGSETQVTLRVGKTDILALFHSRLDVEPGQAIHVRIMPGKAHLFDKASGKRLD
ncbi:MAG: sugar ABC transporter ATP-binding protein [Pelagibacterium sp. SCN 64-44]|nr:MAG: sugar ABC transporter ATP-binding protein [Pelagibacterium sp. SCN 64-44]